MYLNDIPPEIQNRLSDSDFRWKHNQSSTMARFLRDYSVHDSYLCRLEMGFWGTWELILRWDLMAQRDDDLRLKRDAFLCIQFPNVFQIVGSGQENAFDHVILSAETKQATVQQREAWLDFMTKCAIFPQNAGDFLLDENIHLTQLEGTASQISIVHGEPTSFLAMNRDGIPFTIPSISDSP